eukprot:320592-Rhodomonas_salina.1
MEVVLLFVETILPVMRAFLAMMEAVLPCIVPVAPDMEALSDAAINGSALPFMQPAASIYGSDAAIYGRSADSTRGGRAQTHRRTRAGSRAGGVRWGE